MGQNTLLISVMLAGFITACGGSGGGTPAANTVNISGSVSAVNGQVAFYSPDVLDLLIAGIIGKPLFAAITGETSVGPGVNVFLIEVDDTGAQFGAPLVAATTDVNGNYSLEAPEGFIPSSKYVVRAEGATSSADARVDSLKTSIDSTSDAVSSVISTNTMDLDQLSVSELAEIEAAVADTVENTDATTATVDAYRDAIVAAVAEDESVSNVVSSTVTAGQICGTIKDSDGTALENIRIVVRDFGNWVTRAKTKTAADGTYCVNVPMAGDDDQYISGDTLSGEYILGALNFTDTNFAASQWWTTTSSLTDGTGGTNTQFKAEKVTVNSATVVTRDMFLDKDGARVNGTVTGTGGAPVEGMRVVIRNYDTFKPLGSARVKADGTYRINVKATDYLISFRNKTRHPFASEIYRSGTDGVNDRNMASRETMIANQSNTYDAVLDAGVVISGVVTDSGTAVSGEVVYVNNGDGGRIEALRTNKSGNFRLWVNPRLGIDFSTYSIPVAYFVTTRGQLQNADTNGTNDNTATHVEGLTFAAQTTKVSGRLMSADGTPVPVSSAVVFLSSANSTKVSSAADGTFSLYVADSVEIAGHKLFVRMDDDLNYGSGVYNGTAIVASSRTTGASIDTTGVDVDLGDISMPTLNVGNSVGYVVGNAGAGSTIVTFRKGGTTNSFDMVSTRTRGDGSFIVTMPAVNFENVRIKTLIGASCNPGGAGVTVNTGANVTLSNDGAGNCTVTP